MLGSSYHEVAGLRADLYAQFGVEGALSSLVVGERIVSRCADGLFLAEYALFYPQEVVLSGNSAHGVREQGYLTTAQRARERLLAAGITPDLVAETFRAFRPKLMRALARSPSVLLVIDRLGPHEAFEGGLFSAETRTYRGLWLDLEALVTACPLRGTAELLQAIHLAQVLAEVADDVPVRLLTSKAATALKAGERTWREVTFEAASRLPSVLQAMRVPLRKDAIDAGGEIREELLRSLRERSAGARLAEPRFRSLAAALGQTGKTPAPLPKVDPIEASPPAMRPSMTPMDLHLSGASLATADPMTLFEELRGHTQLLRGEDHLRAVAQYLSSMASRSPSQPELGVLASRAWLAAGEPGHARHMARRIAEEAAVPDAVRLLALEIVEITATQQSLPPPAVEGAPIVPMPILLAAPHHQFSPAGASLPPVAHGPFKKTQSMPAMTQSAAPEPPATKLASRPAITASPVIVVDAGPETKAAPKARAPTESTPEFEGASALVPLYRPPSAAPEIVESLALPDGLTESMLAPDGKPSTPAQARIAMTRLSRWLGRDYRLWYGTTLMTSVVAIEAMQRHLRRRFDEKAIAKDGKKKVEWELMRHGALLSEILARTLGAAWAEVPVDKPGHWAMLLHPDIRVWPIGRLYRFFQQGHREADLVSFYLDLEAQVRRVS